MIRISLFGTIDLRDADGSELQGILAQPKRLALLAYLAAAFPAGAHRRDTLLGMFWPELDQGHARNALSQAVHFLRRSLGEDTIVSRSADELALNGVGAWVDVRAFQAALTDDRPADALALYRGDLLPSFFLSGCGGFEEWLEAERDRLRSRAAETARLLADRHERSARLTLAAGCAQRAIELGGADERHLRRMVELLARVGDRAGAVRAYERWTATLTDLGLEPEAETVALMRRVRADPARPIMSSAPGTSSEPAPPASVGDAIGRLRVALAPTYRLESELGAGAMAVVVRARDLRHQRTVAVKILRPELTAAMGAERFLREIEIAAGLVHPHILPLHDSGEAAGVLYYVMPYIDGESLRDRLARERQIPLADAVRIAREVATALGYAHAHGIVHRDIKPENILLAGYPPRDPYASPGWNALVADFGIARAIGSAGGDRLASSGLSGTPAYMSPEQILGDRPVDERTDVYALGCVLYEMLAGEPPYSGTSVETVIARRLHEPPPRPSAVRKDVPAALDSVVTTALARNPADRHSTATRFGEALAGLSEPAAARPRGRLAALAVGLGALVAMAGVVQLASNRVAPIQALAVLPVRAGDTSEAYIAEGITAQLHGGLVRLDGLAVQPRDAVLAEAVKGGTPTEVGKRLGVEWVLTGVLRHDQPRTRLVIDLVRVGQGATRAAGSRAVWSRSYESPDSDLSAIGRSVTTGVARVLHVPLAPPVQAALAARGPRDPAVRDLYLRGSSALGLPDADGSRLAADLFEQAIARDSGFAAAWAGLAAAYQQLSQVGNGAPVETLVLWRRAIDRAIALDSMNGDAYAQRAQIHQVYEWDFPAADNDFRRAVALSPGSAESFMSYAQFLNVVGLDDSALVVMRRAVALTPQVSFRVANLAPRLRMVGRRAEAAAEAHHGLALDSTLWVAHLMLAQLADDEGDLAQAAKESELAYRFAGDLPFVLGTLARYYGASGRPDRARAMLARLDALAAGHHVQRVFRAEALIGVDDREAALNALEASARDREPDLAWKLAYGHFTRLGEEPRYQALLRRVGVGDHSALRNVEQ